MDNLFSYFCFKFDSLRGHKNQITAVQFLNTNEQDPTSANASHLLTSSKDALLKVWDITTQHCIETVVGHRSEVWSMALSADGRTLITGTSDQELHIWNVRNDVLRTKIVSNADAQVSGTKKESQSSMEVDDAPKVIS